MFSWSFVDMNNFIYRSVIIQQEWCESGLWLNCVKRVVEVEPFDGVDSGVEGKEGVVELCVLDYGDERDWRK